MPISTVERAWDNKLHVAPGLCLGGSESPALAAASEPPGMRAHKRHLVWHCHWRTWRRPPRGQICPRQMRPRLVPLQVCSLCTASPSNQHLSAHSQPVACTPSRKTGPRDASL
eukprot:360454-Chlamydomonas_euryale.AAC.4